MLFRKLTKADKRKSEGRHTADLSSMPSYVFDPSTAKLVRQKDASVTFEHKKPDYTSKL